MKTIIAGGREFQDMAILEQAIKRSGFDITEVVSGHCSGADALGEWWATKHGIHLTVYLADWTQFGKRAGPIRNRKMAEYADALIALPGGVGTANMVMTARALGLKTFVVTYDEESDLKQPPKGEQ